MMTTLFSELNAYCSNNLTSLEVTSTHQYNDDCSCLLLRSKVNDVDDDDWRLLQPIWNIALVNCRYTATPLWPILVANLFYFVATIPYIILDFYGLDHWKWVQRYKIEPDVRVTWKQARTCFSLTLWNQLLVVMPITIAQCVWTENSVLPLRAPTVFEFIWQQYVALAIFDLLFYVWHVIHHRVPFLYRHVHSVHHRFSKVNVWVGQYDHPWELISMGVAGTVAPLIIGAHPMSSWAFSMLNDWVGADSHGGYDLPGLPHRWVPFWGGPVKHAMHHQRPLTNFQPYFNYIDRLVGTECPGILAGGRRTSELEEWERKHFKSREINTQVTQLKDE